MAWVRDGESPEQIKVSFVISVKDHPELARFIWSLPYRGASKTLRDILSYAVKAAGGADGTQDNPVESSRLDAGKPDAAKQAAPKRPVRTAVDQQPAVNDVSAAAADIIGSFDRMFPS